MTFGIVTCGLTKYYGTKEVVSQLSLEVEAGHMFGFLGPNGAGKSTSVGMLTTMLTPTAGRAIVAGFDTVRNPDEVRKRVGVVFQNTTLDEDLSCIENLRFQARLLKLNKSKRAQRIDECLHIVGLEASTNVRVSMLSGGMRRRLEVARGILAEPRVLFLDEPTTGLDPQTRRSVWEHLHQLVAEHGVTVFLTTHHLEEAEMCDRVAIIDHGALVVEGTPDQLKAEVGSDRVIVRTDAPEAAAWLSARWGECQENEGNLVVRTKIATNVLADIFRNAPFAVREVSITKPSLDDVFLMHTGTEMRDREVGRVTTDMIGVGR